MKRITAGIFIIILLLPMALSAQFEQARELIIAMESQEVIDSAYVEGRLVINDRFGEKISTFESWSLGSDYSLIEFTSIEEEGQKILRSNDDLYLFYPDADEAIRISGSGLRDGILGSDVSYEDMTGEKSLLDDYRITAMIQETLNGRQVYKISLEALRGSVAYPKQEIWIDAEYNSGVQSYKYSLSGRLLKIESILAYTEQDGYRIPSRIKIEDVLKRNSSTEFIIDNISINVDIDVDFFSLDRLTF